MLTPFFLIFGLSLLLLISGLLFLVYSQTRTHENISNYAIYSKSPIIPPNYYSLDSNISLDIYQPIAPWTGRLILPSKEQRQPDGAVFFEVHSADVSHQDWVGKIVYLRWSNNPKLQEDIRSLTRDVNFTQKTKESEKSGNLHPDRLDGWKKVGPLESLAGARPENDAIVMLKNPIVVASLKGQPSSLVIAQQPVQITGRIYGLVTIIKRESPNSDRFIVRHFNNNYQQFDGQLETIRIPQVPSGRAGITKSTNRDIEKSPLNPSGWYIYGDKVGDGIFIAQAIEPRAIMRLQPDEVRLGEKAAINYIDREWKNTEAQKGTAKTFLLEPSSKERNAAVSNWREGDTGIVIHVFGGIGGKKAEPTTLGVVTGHFAYGIAHVIREPLSNELRFDIEYRQVYANNPEGIIAGTIKWSSYMGDLQRGWLGTRPISDIIVKLDSVTQDYNFDGIKLSPIGEFTRQLDIMTARYRIGDGTGASVVSPVTSCVQDSNQALYVTIKRVEAEIKSNPRIQDWLKRHPNHPQTLRFQNLVSLGQRLERNLVPLGIVRSDWRKNANLEGTGSSGGFLSTVFKIATTWRTVLPRRAHDEIATILLKNDASLWVIRTNQVGGYNPDIAPLAPTAFLGHRTK